MKRKIALLSSFVFLFATVAVFEYAIRNVWTMLLVGVISAMLLLFILTFLLAYVRSGAWRFSHQSIDEMDEREVQLSSKSLRTSYAVFSIVLLAVLLLYAVFQIPVSIVFVVALVMAAHMLPVCMNAWNNKF